jgi:pyrroline-5-carboxylate reductase
LLGFASWNPRSSAAADETWHLAVCTINGILEFEEGLLRVTLIKAAMRATERARQLAAG